MRYLILILLLGCKPDTDLRTVYTKCYETKNSAAVFADRDFEESIKNICKEYGYKYYYFRKGEDTRLNGCTDGGYSYSTLGICYKHEGF